MQRLFLPSTVGHYKIGFSRFQLVNASSKETSNEGISRAFEVLVWYPSDEQSKVKPINYLNNCSYSDLSYLNGALGSENVKKFLSGELTNSVEGIEISNRKDEFPVIIFSHDIGYLPQYYTALMEHFASRGFFIFSINHPQKFQKEYSWKSARAGLKLYSNRFGRFLSSIGFSNASAFNSEIKHMKRSDYELMLSSSVDVIAKDWMGDASFLFEYLKTTNQQLRSYISYSHKFFASRLDLNKVIIMGHGFGGMTLHKLLDHKNVLAFVQLAGDYFALETNQKPSLIIGCDPNKPAIGDHAYTEHQNVKEFTHDSFTDLIFYKHLKNNFAVDHLVSPHLVFNQITSLIEPFIDQCAFPKIKSFKRAIL
jgi:hypothetical protein